MTVITKPLSENKSKNLKEPLVLDKNSKAASKLDVEKGVEPRLLIFDSRARKASTKCLLLLTTLVISIGIIAAVYLFRLILLSSKTHFYGVCTIPYKVQPNEALSESLVSDTNFDTFNNMKNSQFNPDAETFDPENSFTEQFEIDLENEAFEKIVVPDFGKGRKGRFIHDFSSNKTGIVDIKANRCFVMPLDRQKVLPPHSMFDLFEKMKKGCYEVNTEFVREKMKVVIPPITDFKAIGKFIAKECENLKTYLLEKSDPVQVEKRSLPTKEAIFAEFAGNMISEIFIDTSALDEREE